MRMYTSLENPIAFLNIIPLSFDTPRGSTINCRSGVADLFLFKLLWKVPNTSIADDVHGPKSIN